MKPANRKTAEPSADEFVRNAEACSLLGICEKTLRAWVQRGLLHRVPGVLGRTRYRRSEIDALLAQGVRR